MLFLRPGYIFVAVYARVGVKCLKKLWTDFDDEGLFAR